MRLAVGAALCFLILGPIQVRADSSLTPKEIADHYVKILGYSQALALLQYVGTECADLSDKDETDDRAFIMTLLKQDVDPYLAALRGGHKNFIALILPDNEYMNLQIRVANDTARLWKAEFGCSSERGQSLHKYLICLLSQLGKQTGTSEDATTCL